MAARHGKRIGELLSQMVPLSGHDIDEILHEQFATRKPFGDIALSMGLCRPEHIWKAWCGQLLIDSDPRRIDLDSFGIDSQALSSIPHETAHRLNIIPVRVLGDFLIIAASDRSMLDVADSLAELTGKQVRFVLTDADAIRRAISTYYPKLQAAG
jgi:type IV pilus assembly protein PilB